MSEKLANAAKTLSEREKLSAIIWLVIGICQCLSLAGIVAGVWNIYIAILRFQQAEKVKNPWPGIVDTYDKEMTNIIISIVINILLGGVIGVAGALYDMFAVRGYVMDNREIFAEAG